MTLDIVLTQEEGALALQRIGTAMARQRLSYEQGGSVSTCKYFKPYARISFLYATVTTANPRYSGFTDVKEWPVIYKGDIAYAFLYRYKVRMRKLEQFRCWINAYVMREGL